MAAKKPSPAYAFTHDYLKKHGQASFQEVKTAGEKKDLNILPIIFGRAQAVLGLVESVPRGSGKAARKKRAARLGSVASTALLRENSPRRRPESASPGAMDSMESIITTMRNVQNDRDHYRDALLRIADIVHETL